MYARLDIELRELNVFVAVVNAGSMTAAAQHLNLTQSAVSQAIHQLEKKLNSSILDRTARPVTATKAGEYLFVKSVDLLERARTTANSVRECACTSVPELRLMLLNSVASTLGPTLIGNLHDLADAWFVREGVGDEIEMQLAMRDIDVAVVAHELSGVDGLERHQCLVEPFVLAVPANIPEPVNSLKKLAEVLPLLRFSERSADGQRIEYFLQQHRISAPGQVRFDSAASAISAVRAGLGWTFATPLCLVQSSTDVTDVKLLPIPGGAIERQLTLIARANELGTIPARIAEELACAYRSIVVDLMRTVAPWVIESIQIPSFAADRPANVALAS